MRCLTVSDVYDALTSERAYRQALEHDEALKVIRTEAAQGMWDAGLVDLLPDTLAKL